MSFELGIRLIITITAIYLIFSSNLEYKIALSALSGLYLIQFMIFYFFEKSKIYSYINLLVDIAFIIIITATTKNPYFSLFIIPFISSFLRNFKSFLYYFLLSLIPIGFGYYVSNFNAFLLVPISLTAVLGYLKLKKEQDIINKYIRELKDEMENLYIKNISFQEKISQYQDIDSVYDTMKKLKENKINLNSWLYGIYEQLNADGVVLFDFKNSRCVNIGTGKCDKELLKYITEELDILEDTPVNDKLNAKKVVSILCELNGNINCVLLFVYSEELNDDFEKFKIIKDYLTLYFLK
jgi:hypothetical protein